jgi:zinc protease
MSPVSECVNQEGIIMRVISVSTRVLCLVSVLAFSAVSSRPAEDSDVLRATLKNGLRVVVVRNALAPVVTTEINYMVGSNESPEGFSGMAHALEHMMFRGSEGLSADQLSNISAAMGGDFDADTQQTVTQYTFTVPAQDLDVALHIESIRMAQLQNDPKLWDQERGAIEQEVAQDLSNPEYLFYTQLIETMFAGTPYAHDALGTRPSFDKTTVAMLQDFHKSWYAPNNAILVVVGDVDPAKTMENVKRFFEPISTRSLPSLPAVKLEPLKATNIKLGTDLPYGLAAVVYRLPGYNSPDYAAGQVLTDALGSQRADLYGLVPAGKALYAGFQGDSLPVATLGYALAAFPQGADGTPLISTLKDIIAAYLKNGIPADLVEASKRHEIADAEFEKNSISGLATSWSQALAVEGRMSPDDDIKAIRAVTLADVNRVAREFLRNDTALTAVLTPRASGKPTSSKGFGGGESFAPKQTKVVALPDWAQKVLATPEVPPSAVNPTVTTLPNGLRLIVQPETISPTVSLFGRIKNNQNLEAPSGQDGVSQVLGDLFSYGTTSLDRLAFQKGLDDIGANESAGTSFSLQVLADQVDQGVELLATNLLRPALPEAAFKVVQEETAGEVAGELKSPGYLSRRALERALYPKGDAALREVTPASVSALKPPDVQAYYHKVFRPDLTTIVVIGQITPDKARALIEKHFAAWKAEGPKPETFYPPVPPNKPSAAAVPDTSRVQVEVTLAQTLGLTRSDPDYYALQVGNHVLSGAFYATRLYHDLREETGLVYTIDSTLSVGKTRSTFSVFYACDPPKVSQARAMIVRDLKQMQTAPVTATELQQARTLLLRQIPLSEASYDGIASRLLDLATNDLPLDEPIRAARRYLAITAEQVQAAFTKWIRTDDLVQITLGPNPK